MEVVSLPAVSRVAVCGGTHGNEMSGVYLVRELEKKKGEGNDSFSLMTVTSNPRAVQLGRRYVDTDLNRCFTTATFSTPVSGTTPYEIVRAQELNTLLGPKGTDEATDLICDLHNTTANMGLCVIDHLDCNRISLHIFKHLQRKISSVPVRYLHIPTDSETSFLSAVGKQGVGIEIGPQPNGVVRADIFHAMKEGVSFMLEWIQKFNSGVLWEGGEVETYTVVRSIDYPRDPETHSITAMIHPQLQDQDFSLLQPGDPLFLTFSGKTETYRGTEPLYPVFVNECAYYEKGIAFLLARKRKVTVPSIQVKRD